MEAFYEKKLDGETAFDRLFRDAHKDTSIEVDGETGLDKLFEDAHEDTSINESPKPAECERYYNPSGPDKAGGGRVRSRVLRGLPVLTEGGYDVRANDLPIVHPSNNRLESIFMRRGFFYGFLAFITSAPEHQLDKFIKTHWFKVEIGTFLGLIGFYLSYARLVIWGVGMFAHGSRVLQIILCSLPILLLCLPAIMEYYRIKKNEFKFTSEEKKILKAIEPTMKTLENIMQRYEYYQPLGEADQEFVSQVFDHHPRKAEKLDGSQIKHFTVAGHGICDKVRIFYLVLENGKMVNFSYYSCVGSYVKRRYREEAEAKAEAFWTKVLCS